MNSDEKTYIPPQNPEMRIHICVAAHWRIGSRRDVAFTKSIIRESVVWQRKVQESKHSARTVLCAYHSPLVKKIIFC